MNNLITEEYLKELTPLGLVLLLGMVIDDVIVNDKSTMTNGASIEARKKVEIIKSLIEL